MIFFHANPDQCETAVSTGCCNLGRRSPEPFMLHLQNYQLGPRKLWGRGDLCSVLGESTAQLKSRIRVSVQRSGKLAVEQGTWKGWSEGSCGKEPEWYRKVTCLAMRRGGAFGPQRGYYVCYLQHLHLLLDMLWALKTGLWQWWGYSFRALINKEEFPFSIPLFCKVLEAQFILVAPPRGHKGMLLLRLHSSCLPTYFCYQKSRISPWL